jgi:hypothetical protein
MEENSNVILCVGQPVWAYCQDRVIPEFRNFAFASLIVSGGFPRLDHAKSTRHHNVRVVLTGDAHHYSHFIELGNDPSVFVHYLTSRLGGALLHPTHWLRDIKVDVEWHAAQPLVQSVTDTLPDGTNLYTREFKLVKDDATGGESPRAVFPDRKTSARLAWRNLGFAIINPQFALFVAILALFCAWLLHFGSVALNTTLAELRALPLGDAIRALIRLLLVTPWPAV